MHQATNIVCQGPAIWERTAEEEKIFQRALTAWGALYMHQHITVLVASKLPAGYPTGYAADENANTAECFDRGWMFAELAWSTLIKRPELVLNLGKLSGHEISRADLTKSCMMTDERPPPMTPAEVAMVLEAKQFADAERDRPLVTCLFSEVCTRMLRRVRTLQFASLRWGDAEATQLCRLLGTGACVHLETLHLSGNRFTDIGLAAVTGLVSSGVLPALSLITTDRPNYSDLRKACEAREVLLAKPEVSQTNGGSCSRVPIERKLGLPTRLPPDNPPTFRPSAPVSHRAANSPPRAVVRVPLATQSLQVTSPSTDLPRPAASTSRAATAFTSCITSGASQQSTEGGAATIR